MRAPRLGVTPQGQTPEQVQLPQCAGDLAVGGIAGAPGHEEHRELDTYSHPDPPPSLVVFPSINRHKGKSRQSLTPVKGETAAGKEGADKTQYLLSNNPSTSG